MGESFLQMSIHIESSVCTYNSENHSHTEIWLTVGPCQFRPLVDSGQFTVLVDPGQLLTDIVVDPSQFKVWS